MRNFLFTYNLEVQFGPMAGTGFNPACDSDFFDNQTFEVLAEDEEMAQAEFDAAMRENSPRAVVSDVRLSEQ